MTVFRYLAGIVFLLMSGIVHADYFTPRAPSGWVQQKDNDHQAVSYFPQGQSQVVNIKFYARQSLQGLTLRKWVEKRFHSSSAPEGQWEGRIDIVEKSPTVVTGHRSYQSLGGENKGVFVKAIVVDGMVQMAANIHTHLPNYKAFKSSADQIMVDFENTVSGKREKPGKLTAGNSLKLEGGKQYKLPQGWARVQGSGSDVVAFQPEDVADREVVSVKYYPKVLLEDMSVEGWLARKLGTSDAPSGKWSAPARINKMTSNISRGQRNFVVNGQKKTLKAYAVSVDKTYVRLSAIVHSNNSRYQYYQSSSAKIAAEVFNDEKQAAIREKRGLDLELSPPNVSGIKKGGSIKAGRYVGTKTSGDKIWSRYDLMLFDNGEYQFLDGKNGKSGRYSYSPLTGKLDITRDFRNSSYDHTEDFCIYGIEQSSNKSIIYAEDGGGLSTQRYRLRWVGDVDRPAPSEVERQKALAEKEANRYKWVTEPGKGVKHDDIEAVLYTFDTAFTVGGMKKEEYAYLLLKDGRVMDGIPVTPESLDVVRSRSREPDRWGWWKKQGKHYEFSWTNDRKKYNAPNGTQFVAYPVAPGTRLDGDWSSSSSFAVGEFSSVSFWGVKFSSKGRFVKYQNGMTQAGGEMNDLGPLVTSAWNDDGAVTAVIGSSVGGGSRSVSQNPASDRMGWYEFEGYGLVLKFDSGRIERVPAFSDEVDTLETLWFDSGTLRKK
ncbi:MAG: hypothetical protein ACRBHB_15645 [Arenicella sp.]